MSETMIDRVGIAIADEFANQNQLMLERRQVGFDAKALGRAAIAAMREPTEEMCSAGYRDDHSDWRVTEHEAGRIWRDMCDAALGHGNDV